MSKKDPTTKTKALQEFSSLLNSKPPSDPQTTMILNQWVRFVSECWGCVQFGEH